MKILILHAERLGDVAVSIPAIEALRRHYPQATLHVLTSTMGEKLLQTHPAIDWVSAVPWKTPTLRELWHLAQRIRTARYDLYICLSTTLWGQALGWAAGIPRRLGEKAYLVSRWLLTDSVPVRWDNMGHHRFMDSLAILGPLGISHDGSLPTITVDPTAVSAIRKRLSDLPPDRPLVTIFCDTSGSTLPIPDAILAKTIPDLIQTFGVNVALTSDTTRADSPLHQLKDPHVLDILDFLPLPDLIALLSLSNYYIGPDTGPTHLASLMGIPLVLFAGKKINPPTKWGPLSPFFVILREDYHCESFCTRGRCDAEQCVTWLTPRHLVDAFRTLWDQVKAAKPMPWQARLDAHWLATVRVLYVTTDLDEELRTRSLLKRLWNDGLRIFPMSFDLRHPLRSFRTLLRQAIRHNATVIHGPVLPFWAMTFLRWYYRFWLHYPPPKIYRGALAPEADLASLRLLF